MPEKIINMTYLQIFESGDPYQPTECMLGDNQPQIYLKLPPSRKIRLNWCQNLSEFRFELIWLQYASFSFFIVSCLSGP